MQETGVWLSFPIADGLSIIVSSFFIARLFNKFKKRKDGGDATILGSNL